MINTQQGNHFQPMLLRGSEIAKTIPEKYNNFLNLNNLRVESIKACYYYLVDKL
jgi:hypothetical protein